MRNLASSQHRVRVLERQTGWSLRFASTSKATTGVRIYNDDGDDDDDDDAGRGPHELLWAFVDYRLTVCASEAVS